MKDINLNITLGNRIKQVRKQQKITRETLSEKIDVSSRFMADVESGKAGVSLSTLKKLCKALGVSADFLLGITQQVEPSNYLEQIITRLNQLDPQYLPYANDLLMTFINATGSASSDETL